MSLQKPKILLMIDTLRVGGAEKQFLELARRMNKEEWEISLFLAIDGGPLLEELSSEDFSHIKICHKKNHLDHFTTLFKLIKFIRSWKPDVIHSWLPYSCLLNSLAGILNPPPYLKIMGIRVSPKQFTEGSFISKLFNQKLFSWTCRRGDYLLSNSSSTFQDFEKMGISKEKFSFIPNGVNLKDTGLSKVPSKDKKDTFSFFSAGRLEKQKNYPLLIEAFHEVHQASPKTKLIIAGEGSQKEELSQLIQKLNLENSVSLIGFQKNLSQHYLEHDAFVLSSSYEGMPNVLMEAMKYGKPIIATRVDGVLDLLKDQSSGLLVEAGSKSEMVQGMVKLYQDSSLSKELGKKAREEIEKFQFSSIVKAYEDLYTRLLK